MKPTLSRWILLLVSIFFTVNLPAQSVNWGFKNGGANADAGAKIYRDAAGNIYQCGSFSGPSIDIDPSSATYLLYNNGGTDGFVAKYDASGNFVTGFSIGGIDNDAINDIGTDAQGNIYITGFFRYTVDFDPSPTAVHSLTSNGQGGSFIPAWGGDAFVAKYSSTGTYQWAFNIGGQYVYDAGNGISVSPDGSVYVCGQINMSDPIDFDPSPTVTHYLYGLGGFAFLAKYNTNGQYIWAFNCGGAYANSAFRNVKLDHASGAVYVCGFLNGPSYDMDPSPTATYTLFGTSEDPVLAKYDTNMVFKWAFNVPTSGVDEAFGLDIDASNVYFSGYFRGNGVDFDPSPGNNTSVNSNGGQDLFVAKYTKTGVYRWVKTIGGPGDDVALGVSVNGDNVYSTGNFSNTVDFDPSPAVFNLSSAGGSDGFALKQDTAGNFRCAFRFGGASDDGGTCLKAADNNQLFLSGNFYNTISLSPLAGSPTLASNGSMDMFLAAYLWNGCNNDTNKIINKYAAVTNRLPCSNIISVDTATDFNVGDTILMIQMKGAVIDSTNTASFGNITNYNGAGNYEYNVIKAKTGNDLTLKYKILRNYDIPNGKVQIVRVPYVTNYTVNTPHTCMPWNGSKGGVFVLNVSNTLTLNEKIDVSGKGFVGATSNIIYSPNMVCSLTSYFMGPNVDSGGMKGEGFAVLSFSKSYGRGKLGNGGGGGNAHNAGGGGGGNAGNGGIGGNQFYGCNNTPATNITGGVGGSSSVYSNSNNKIFLGGGGGSTQANNLTDARGGNGGGIVIITSNAIAGNTQHIAANGSDALGCINTGAYGVCHDGMGGGGAAGVIVLNTNVINGNLLTDIYGGQGGNESASAVYNQVGPGGGGSGGTLWIKSNTLPSNVIVANNGGANGVVLYNNDPWGAQSGQAGTTVTGLQLPFPVDTFTPSNIVADFKDTIQTCFTWQFTNLSQHAAALQWVFPNGSNSSLTNPVYTFPGYGIFPVKLIVTDSNGCKDSIVKNVSIIYHHFANAGNDTSTCNGGTVTLHASGGTTYSWTPTTGLGSPASSTTSTHITAPITYTVHVVDSIGCPDADSVHISITYHHFANAGNDTSACNGGTVTLHASGGNTYSWTPTTGLGTPTTASTIVHVAAPITYTVHVVDALGCIDSDMVNISIVYHHFADAGNDTGSCIGGMVSLHASGGVNYSWSPTTGLSAPTSASTMVHISGALTYVVTVRDSLGCIDKDSVHVNIIPGATITAGPKDTLVCKESQVSLHANGTVTSYSWQPSTGLTDPTISNPKATINGPTSYVVTGTADNGCTISDTVTINTRPDPVISIHSDKDNISCTDRSMRLFASGALSYLWSPGFYCNDSTIASPVVTPPGTTLFTVKGTDIFGCKGIGSIRVTSSQEEIVFVPDAFTPNGDGLNDVIKPVVFCNFDFQQFCVFDRWGKNVFISYILNHGWDGTYNGVLQPMDVYYYFVKGQKNDGSTEIIKGSFTLIR